MRALIFFILFAACTAGAQRTPRKKPRPAPAATVPAQVVRAIDIQGQRKIEKDAIVARLKSRVGQPSDSSTIREDVLSLFKSGYFLDVQVDRKNRADGIELTYKVTEKASITEIDYEGNSELKSEELAEATGIKPYEILNMAKVREGVEKIQKLYEDKGFFLAKIDTQIVDIKKDESVKLTFKITEGEKVKVKKILFIGNNHLSENFLKGRMMTQEEGYFSSLSGSGAYKQEAFERDVQILRLSYYSQGFVKAQIDRPLISVTPDKKGIYLTIRVEEGEQYDVGEVDFAGHLLFPREELFETIKIDDGKIFAYDVLQRDLSELQAKYGDLGYAYANIIPRWEFRKDSPKINVVFEIDKGNKVYFGRIDVISNTKTRDKVVRRELKIHEGELYNETKRRESLEAIQRLGFFEDVNFKTSTPSGQLDVMNVEIVVKERNTGQVQVSAGYGTSTGATFGGSVQETNFRGRGQNLGVSMQLTSISSVYDVSYTEPYFNDSLWSLGARVFQSTSSGRLDYDEKRTGGEVSLGHPLGDYLRADVRYRYTTSILNPIYGTDKDGKSVVVTDYDLFPLRTAEGDASTFEGTLSYDTRNDRMRPTKGILAQLAVANTGGIGGNKHYNKGSATLRYFRNLFWDVTWRNSVQWSKIASSNGDPVPFNELFLLGGPYSLRGFRFAQVGRRIFSNKSYTDLKALGYDDAKARDMALRYYGGEQQVQYLTELQFPMIREADIFGVVFMDIGQAEDQLTPENYYYDWGLGLRWFSPIGPLRFEWGFPLKRDTVHANGVFEFSIGTPF